MKRGLYGLLLAGIVINLIVRAQNPRLTEWQLLTDFWWLWLAWAAIASIYVCFAHWSER